MGWKVSFIVIQNPGNVSLGSLLKELGFTNLKPAANQPFHAVINLHRNKRQVFAGLYNGHLLLCSGQLPTQVIEQQESAIERRLIELFPHSEIAAFILHSVVNLWGYAIIRNGIKIRARAGSGDDGTYLEYGEPEPEEVPLLEQSILEDGQRMYYLDGPDNEPYTEDQMGEEFVFEIAARYIDDRLCGVNDQLFEMPMEGYSYKDLNPLFASADEARPWWKFW